MNNEVIYYVDPRNFDGTPYEAAGQAVDQLISMSAHMQQAIGDAGIVIRSAEMERQIAVFGAPEASAFENGPQRALLTAMQRNMEQQITKLRALKIAATYDPKHPPKVNG